jgi:hypothetical protein
MCSRGTADGCSVGWHPLADRISGSSSLQECNLQYFHTCTPIRPSQGLRKRAPARAAAPSAQTGRAPGLAAAPRSLGSSP